MSTTEQTKFYYGWHAPPGLAPAGQGATQTFLPPLAVVSLPGSYTQQPNSGASITGALSGSPMVFNKPPHTQQCRSLRGGRTQNQVPSALRPSIIKLTPCFM